MSGRRHSVLLLDEDELDPDGGPIELEDPVCVPLDEDDASIATPEQPAVAIRVVCVNGRSNTRDWRGE